MKLRLQKVNLNNTLFYISYGLFLVITILGTSFYYQYFIGIPYIIMLLFSICLLMLRELLIGKNTRKGIMSAMLCFVLLIIAQSVNMGGSEQSTVVAMIIFIYCAKNIPFEKIARFTVIISASLLLFVVFSSYANIIQNIVAISSATGRRREYLGFRYTLYSSVLVFNITALEITIKKEKITWKELLVLIVVNGWFFNKTSSRLAFFFAIGLILVAAILKVYPYIFEKHGMICKLMCVSFVVCFIISYYITAAYDSRIHWMKAINTLVERRVELGNISLNQYGISLFGQKIAWIGNGLNAFGEKSAGTYLYVDNFYIQVLQRYGLLFIIFLLALFTFAFIRCYQRKEYHYMVVLVFIAMHGLIDDLILYLYFNTFWFIIGTQRFRNIDRTDRCVTKSLLKYKKRKVRFVF